MKRLRSWRLSTVLLVLPCPLIFFRANPSGRPLQRSNRTVAEINSSLEKYKNQPDSSELAIAEAEEWTVTGATACPKEKTLRQREKYFKNVEFLSLREMLGLAEREGFV